MAKIIFYKNPIDRTDYKMLEDSDKCILDILCDLRISKESLSVTINGLTPDDIDLNYVVREEDMIEIRRVVHGGSGEKRGLAAIIQIAALIIVNFVAPPIGIALTIGASIIAGALNARANAIDAANARKGLTGGDDIAADSFSITSATNAARALQPMILPMGSNRYPPDYETRPDNRFERGTFNSGNFYSVEYKQFTDGPEADLLGNWLNPGSIAISPYVWYPYQLAICSPGVNSGTIAAMSLAKKQSWAPTYVTIDSHGKTTTISRPIILWHKDPSDPHYGRYTTLAILYAQNTLAASQAQALIDYGWWFDASVPTPSWFTSEEFSEPAGAGIGIYNERLLWKMGSNPSPLLWGFAVEGVGYTTSPYMPFVRNHVVNILNGGNKNGSTTIGFVSRILRLVSFLGVKDVGVQSIDHVFNYGLGDIDVSDRRIEKVSLDDAQPNSFSPINKGVWQIPGIPRQYFLDNTHQDNKKLINESSKETQVNRNDMNPYNFVYYTGPIGANTFGYNTEALLYYASDTGMQSNQWRIELQWKASTDAVWTNSFYDSFYNNNTAVYRDRKEIGINLLNPDTDFMEVRIRKMDLDANNNAGQRSADITVVDPTFYALGTLETRKPLNLEGVTFTSSNRQSGQINKFTALVDSKCFTFDGTTWTWEVNRNPAWWFLYFAIGGFKNDLTTLASVYPDSPTLGWTNNAENANNIEIMFGAGLKRDEIDMDAIKEWAIFCDDNNLNMDLVFKEDSNCNETLEKIANVGRGSVTYNKGLLGVVYEDPLQVPTCLFGMGNIIAGSFSVDYAVANAPASVVGTYVNRDKDWESREVTALVPFATPENIKVVKVNFEGVTEEQQAQREVNILAARQFFQRRSYEWKVDFEGLIAKRGDLVYLSHDSTQYGFSGRIKRYIMNGALVSGVETTSELQDSSIAYVTIRYPDGEMATFSCSVSGPIITFLDPYPISKAPRNLDVKDQNLYSDYANSNADDFVFIAGAKATPGKLVRISNIKTNDKMEFTISALDEDPSMWSYEYGPPTTANESFYDSNVVLSLANVSYEKLGGGLVKISWENVNGDMITIINEYTSTPIEANGAYSFTGGEVILELNEGQKYTLRIEPFAIGTPYKMVSKTVVLWA